jgi:DNA/RNA endonuclease G (NUC1)
MIVTNAAPQWQKFNGNNWARIEDAVKDSAKAKNTQLYVFTGTGRSTKKEFSHTKIDII